MRTIRLVTRAAAAATAVFLAATLTATAARADEGKELYEKNCVSCHGATGKGDGAAGQFLKPPPGDLATVLKGAADADIIKVIKEGGKAVGKSASMPGFGSKLSDDQVQKLVDYVKGFSSK